MRILAYKPPPARQTVRMERLICCEPLELEYLYTVLDGHDVRLLDGMVDRNDPRAIVQRWCPDIVLVTAFVTTVDAVRSLARDIKRGNRGIRLFVGGPHAEVVPEHFDSPDIDGIVFTDQLRCIRSIVDRIAAGSPFHDVPGLAYRDGNRFARNGTAVAMTDVPDPRRVLLAGHARRYRYLYFGTCASVKTAFGCTGGCSFCFCRRMNGGSHSVRSLDRVVREIRGINADNVFILDDNFLADRERAMRFCARIVEEGVRKRFIIYGTVHAVATDPELMRALKRAGVRMVIAGFEYVTDRELKAVGKRSTAAENDTALAVCRRLDIELVALFICSPAWRHADFRRLAAYVRRRGIAFATFSTETVFPGRETPPEALWRFDLLRLHERPRHMTVLSYYLWLYVLYLLPGTTRAGMRTLLRRYGPTGAVALLARSTLIGLDYLVKLFIWR